MPLYTIDDLFSLSSETNWALPHFNMLNVEVLQGVIQAAEQARAPVILAMGPSSIAHVGLPHLAALIKSVAAESTVPMALHLDHAKELSLIRQALDCGFTSVMFDGSSLPYSENLRLTTEVAKMAHDKGASVEGEIGIVPEGEEALATAEYTDPAQAIDFAKVSGVDLLAVSVGSSHRMRSQEAALDIPLIRTLSEAAGIPLVLHGGSGVMDADIAQAIACGLRKVNISTALKRAFMEGIRQGIADSIDHNPLVVMQCGRKFVQDFALERIRLCKAYGKGEPTS